MAEDGGGGMPSDLREVLATPGLADLADAFLALDDRVRPALVELARAMAPPFSGSTLLDSLPPETQAAICDLIAARSRVLAAQADTPEESEFYVDLSARWRGMHRTSPA